MHGPAQHASWDCRGHDMVCLAKGQSKGNTLILPESSYIICISWEQHCDSVTLNLLYLVVKLILRDSKLTELSCKEVLIEDLFNR